MRRFGRGHSAHARGDRPVKDGVRKREQRADLERARSRRGDDEHAAKAHQQRQPARQADCFLEQQRRGERRKQRRGEIDGGGAGERHQAERDQQECLRAALRNRAQHVMAKALRAEHGKPGVRQDEERAGEERDRRAGEQHLADRIARHQPFRDCARNGEHDRGADHVENAERDMLPPRGLR